MLLWSGLLVCAVLLFILWAHSVTANICRLSSRKRKARLAAVRYLGKRKGERVARALLGKLMDEDREIRQLSRECLDRSGIGREKLLLGYVKALSSTTEEASREAASAIISLASSGEISDALIDGLVGMMGFVATKPKRTKNAETEVMQNQIVQEARTHINAKRVWGEILKTNELKIRGYKRILLSPQHSLYSQAERELEALCPMKDELFRFYLEALNGSYSVQAAAALAKFDDPRARDPIYNALSKVTSVYWRGRFAIALGRLGDRRAVMDLIRYIEIETHTPPRQEAVQVLGALKDPAAVETLFRLAGNSYVDGFSVKAPRWEGSAQHLAAQALADYEHFDIDVVPKLVGLLTSPDSWHVAAAILILRRHPELHARVVRPLIPLLTGVYNRGVKAALIMIGGQPVVDSLVATYRGRPKEDDGFTAAREILQELGATEAEAQLSRG